MNNYLLETCNITKRFGVVEALKDVSLKVRDGEVHVLCGENGAGKSTLMNIIGGVIPYGSFEGSFYFNGEKCQFKGIKDSENKNISFIHQHFTLIHQLSIAENIFLGNENAKNGIINWNETREQAREYMRVVGLTDSPDKLIKDLGAGKKQLVEICKAISRKVKLLILDEPTAALTEEESQNLLDLVLDFKKEGVTSILISHKISELTKIYDAITILRDGKLIETLYKGKDIVTREKIVKSMVGRDLTDRFPSRSKSSEKVILSVENWSVFNPNEESKQVLKNINITLRKGEILGVAGLMGSGRTELAMSIFGKSYGTKITGKLIKNGKKLEIKNVSDAINNGIAYVSEDRHLYGIISDHSIKNNITLPSLSKFTKHLAINESKEYQTAENYRQKLDIKSYSVGQLVKNLSGGNQQKVVFSKWVLTGAEIIIFDEPTRGIDIGAKFEIYKMIKSMAMEGKSIVFISSEMPELVGMCNRVYVINEGRIVGELEGEEITQEKIMDCIMEGSRE